MKKLKNRWENELKTAVPALSDSVKNAAIPKAETQNSIVKTPSSKVEKNRRKIWQKGGFWTALSGSVACAVALAVILPNALKKPTASVSAEEMKVMNVSCNPSVEFVLDEDDVVVSANALNEEGNLVVSAETFVGKTAEEAACLFVEIAQESGFIVVGDAELVGASNKIVIAFSGNESTGEKLFGGVRVRIEEYFSEKNIDGVIERGEKVTEEKLEEALSECLPYIEKEKIREMDYETLMKELAKARKETENIYSQELKAAYYEMKSFALEQAELEAVKANADTITSVVLDAVYTEYTKAVSNIETLRMEYLVNEDSPYQQALEAFRAAKVEYLQYRNEVAQMGSTEVPQEVLDTLVAYEETLGSLQEELIALGEWAHNNLDVLRAQIKDLLAEIDGGLQGLGIDKETIAESIVAERDKADKEFREKFETKCEKEIGEAHDRWTEMKGELDKGKSGKESEIPDMEGGEHQGNELPDVDGEHQGEENPEVGGENVPGFKEDETLDEYGQAHP